MYRHCGGQSYLKERLRLTSEDTPHLDDHLWHGRADAGEHGWGYCMCCGGHIAAELSHHLTTRNHVKAWFAKYWPDYRPGFPSSFEPQADVQTWILKPGVNLHLNHVTMVFRIGDESMPMAIREEPEATAAALGTALSDITAKSCSIATIEGCSLTSWTGRPSC